MPLCQSSAPSGKIEQVSLLFLGKNSHGLPRSSFPLGNVITLCRVPGDGTDRRQKLPHTGPCQSRVKNSSFILIYYKRSFFLLPGLPVRAHRPTEVLVGKVGSNIWKGLNLDICLFWLRVKRVQLRVYTF